MKMKNRITILVIVVILFAVSGTGCFSLPSKTDPGKKINVELTYDFVMEGDRVVFTIDTNLPDHGILWLRLFDRTTLYSETEEIFIKDGTGKAKFWIDAGPIVPGEYNVELSLPVAELQPQKFLDFAGEKYENLEGELVHDSGGGKHISIVENVVLE